MQSQPLKKTALNQRHAEHGGKLVPFAGWELPVQYSGIIQEHLAVRNAAGVFDVSHMGEIFISGKEAEQAVDFLTCNNIRALSDGKAQYSAITNDQGGLVDDIIVYRISTQKYLLCVNASNIQKDFSWLVSKNKFDAEIKDRSSEYSQIAFQGPKAKEIVSKLEGGRAIVDLGYFCFCETKFLGEHVIAARTGYTGEDGFEFFVSHAGALKIWDSLVDFEKNDGVLPCGLGARDSLRLEACYPLYGHELGDNVSAFESGLAWVVKLDKPDFVGKVALANEKATGSKRSLVGFFVDQPGILRQHDKLFSSDGIEIGEVTSGTKTPSFEKPLGMALVQKQFSKIGTQLTGEVRGRKIACHVEKRPFYNAVKS